MMNQDYLRRGGFSPTNSVVNRIQDRSKRTASVGATKGMKTTNVTSFPPLLTSTGGNNSSNSLNLKSLYASPTASKSTSPSHSTAGMKEMLTQAPNVSSTPNALLKTGERSLSPKGGVGKVQSGEESSPLIPCNERRLAMWQKQPTNLSPAAHLTLEPMIPLPMDEHQGKKLLLLDIDETLVHASFSPAKPYNAKITISLEGETGDIYVAYRPHLHTFLSAVAPLFEVAVFTASQSCYADQLMNAIDPTGKLVTHRLFREHCTEVNGARVKDLSLLGRPLEQLLLVDNSPVTYLFQPRNAVPITSFFDDPRDTELLKLLPVLRQLAKANTVYDVLDRYNCRL